MLLLRLSPALAPISRILLMTLIVLTVFTNKAAAAQQDPRYDHDRLRAHPRAPPPIRPPTDPHGQPNQDPGPNSSHLLCNPFGACEPCPPASLHQPFCQPFGNRRLMHCTNATDQAPRSARHALPDASSEDPSPEFPHEKGETLAWESCGRIPAQERADFLEFVACNVAFALLALGVVVWRSKVVQARQARVLAARIGLVGRGRR